MLEQRTWWCPLDLVSNLLVRRHYVRSNSYLEPLYYDVTPDTVVLSPIGRDLFVSDCTLDPQW